MSRVSPVQYSPRRQSGNQKAIATFSTFKTISAGNRARLNFNLKDYSMKAEVMTAVDRIDYRGRNTNTTGGLKVARLEVFHPSYAFVCSL